MRRSAYLLLEDGRWFPGESIGATGVATGEMVFNTTMTGYQEVLTDPSYSGQLVAMTAPMIGNYGVAPADDESDRPQVAGFVVRELATRHSSWRATGSLDAFLRENGVAGLTEVDTRALTRHIRSCGAMRGAIVPDEVDRSEALERIRAHPRMEGRDLTGHASADEPYARTPDGPVGRHVVAYDFGVKSRSIDYLVERGCRVTVVPGGTPWEEALDRAPDGLFLSNGPGDPEAVPHALEAIRRTADRGIPVFGICLGHQLIARAFGGRTFKLRYGHRGGNQPVRRLEDGAVEITAQNHGFAVRRGAGETVEDAPALRVTHVNLNDDTIEGLAHRELPVFSVQYHPEAAPGPNDAAYFFDEFLRAMGQSQGTA